MKITITSKNFTPSENLKSTIEKKFAKLNKYFSSDVEASVMLSNEKNHRQRLEATIRAAGMIFRAEEMGEDVEYCIDKSIDKLSAQMSKFKTKLVRHHKEQKELIVEDIPDALEPEEEKGVEKVKRFKLNPMSADEAALQMEMLGHTFYVYKDGDTGAVCVVYKRKDGTYGILETEE